ncbi:MAG: hypothetical protein J5582_05995 [Ruminococcus sp.]|uniref:hypothetical protein n=1 Tax=Ruminococcus sp. TaxID=41978 RepID=UPI0025D7E77C|nr:hypothetical protein [Ruminococcus sp.]MBO4866108.1 hypothetical protein [Ruminococcus sp.]
MLFSGKRAPTINARRKIVPYGAIRSGIVFSVSGGLGRLCNVSAVCHEDYANNSITMLNGTPVVQSQEPWCPTCRSLLMAGYGIENADCPELREICDAVNADFIDIEHSFDILKPLLGLLNDGYYLLADAECIPTDGEGHFFWDIDPALKEYDAAVQMYYLLEEDGFDMYACESVEPIFLYPTQSAALYNSERAEYYRIHNDANENAPRAIAYGGFYGISALLDGHHKAAAAALNGQRVKCLLIIPAFEQFFCPAGGDWEFRRQVFTEDIFLKAEEFTAKEKAEFLKKWLADREEQKLPPKYEHSEPRFSVREWEKVYSDNAKKYPTVRQLSLEKYFGLDNGFGEVSEKLRKGIEEGKTLPLLADNVFGIDRQKGIEIPAIKLMLIKAEREGDRSLKELAAEIVRTRFGGYVLVAAALMYLLMFNDDCDVEKMFVDIISDADDYKRFGDIAVNYWQDVPDA